MNGEEEIGKKTTKILETREREREREIKTTQAYQAVEASPSCSWVYRKEARKRAPCFGMFNLGASLVCVLRTNTRRRGGIKGGKNEERPPKNLLNQTQQGICSLCLSLSFSLG